MSLYDRIFKPHVYTLADGTAVEEKRSRAPLILLVLIALTVLSVRITGFDLAVLVKKGSKFFDILKAMFPPNTAYLGKIWQPLWDTIKMSILGSFIGAVLAVPFAVAAASNIVTNRVVVFLVRLFSSHFPLVTFGGNKRRWKYTTEAQKLRYTADFGFRFSFLFEPTGLSEFFPFLPRIMTGG